MEISTVSNNPLLVNYIIIAHSFLVIILPHVLICYNSSNFHPDFAPTAGFVGCQIFSIILYVTVELSLPRFIQKSWVVLCQLILLHCCYYTTQLIFTKVLYKDNSVVGYQIFFPWYCMTQVVFTEVYTKELGCSASIDITPMCCGLNSYRSCISLVRRMSHPTTVFLLCQCVKHVYYIVTHNLWGDITVKLEY